MPASYYRLVISGCVTRNFWRIEFEPTKVTHVSAIYNGPLYGLTNQRFKPAYQAAVGEKEASKQSVTGHTNEAFSDEVL